jgi:hypothetical protein
MQFNFTGRKSDTDGFSVVHHRDIFEGILADAFLRKKNVALPRLPLDM